MSDTELTPFDVLEIISSAYGGKQIFFLQDNGMVYDRYECDYVTLEEAVYRMAERVGEDGDATVDPCASCQEWECDGCEFARR